VEKLTNLINKRKTEILIPEIKAVAQNSEGASATGTTDSKKVNNEESGSTSNSINGELPSKISGQLLAQSGAPGAKPARTVPAVVQ